MTAGHEGMREETYMMERPEAGRLSVNGDTYANVSKPTSRSAKPPPPPPLPPVRRLTDSGTEPQWPAGTEASPPATPSSTFSFNAATGTTASGGGRKPRLNHSLSQQSGGGQPQHHQYRSGSAAAAASAAVAAAAAYEDQELVMDIRSVATSFASTLANSRVADKDEDTHL